MRRPRIHALGTLLMGLPFDSVTNPVIFDLEWPGHPQHGSSITLETFKAIKGDY